ncbi:diguanylate cyclase/phosphodiesterase (EAL & GGDEF domains) [Sulfurimonas gotlandica GD1]|uniref:Diguanylate cyclase/phosphodiesterase (EAL & GGDEF domains) n=1 Tax=Sulfurimonas gotlandica (strain DSM 19862 / JCM 16533 / GD1) TaxID=929558 RepID=B6BL97_SULGG|nr:GGDEF and EAL domain-containing protein [Sulfurimonas gotlandica]EDZ62043.1 ggdef family protein [Sulfurimonas gotlandica GD1]EHP28550.1 diguanylate cyclase/phosphodiesterase (EAL & GGDEF domains) [Sulfurimonas gotlandica GD1]
MNFELLKTISLLYVEDELTLQEEVCQNLAPFVKEIFTANNGEEGLKYYIEHRDKIDLIVTDILMPNLSGIDMIDEIREIDSEVPVIYSTAFSDSEYLKKTIEQSVTGYIIKPIDVELLLKAIEKASIKIENDKLKNSLQEINEDLEKKIEEKTKELRLQNEKLYYQLHTDRLTSLKNRKSLLRDLKKVDRPILLIIDIDSFKSINDLYGEHIGNLVLDAVSKILKNFVKHLDCDLYRIGADQFALMKEAELDKRKCEETVKSILNVINSEPLNIVDYDIVIRVNVTIGVSHEKVNTLESADMALKKAKTDRLQYLIYSDEYSMDAEYKNDVKWTKIIEKAIKLNKVIVYYQPVVNSNEKIVKYEALMRIEDDGIIYPPMLFLDIAKKVKFYPQLTKIVIQKAFEQAQEKRISININLSIEDVVNLEIIKFIEDELSKRDISYLITFEILESESITDYRKVIDFIDNVKQLGCKIAIDDFGSGYSNFAYLLKFKPDYIKIDGSLVKNIHIDNNSFLITKTINDFAHSLGIKTVAEFVHCDAVFKLLQTMDIDEFQGFYFSEPLEKI